MLVLSAGSEIAKARVGDAAAEARARAAIDQACVSESCSGSLTLKGDVPLVRTLRSWQRVFGDREQALSLGPFGESNPDGDEDAGHTAGKLPPEVIQQVVRRNFPNVQACYQSGLARNPKLLGLLEVRFTIDVEGVATNVEDCGSNLPDPVALRCSLDAFKLLRFPPPEGGVIITVVYPVVLLPN